MKKVSFVVELFNENGEIQYAYLYRGIMTRKYIYAKACHDDLGDKTYILVQRNQTQNDSKFVRSAFKHLYDQDRSISVRDEIGLYDPRIISITPNTKLPEGIKVLLEEFCLECEKEEKEWSKKISL